MWSKQQQIFNTELYFWCLSNPQMKKYNNQLHNLLIISAFLNRMWWYWPLVFIILHHVFFNCHFMISYRICWVFFLLAHFLLYNRGYFRDLFCSQQICWQRANHTYVYFQYWIAPVNTLRWQSVSFTAHFETSLTSHTGSILQTAAMCLSFKSMDWD